MSDEEIRTTVDGVADDTAEELLEQARSNAQAAIIATVAFLRDEGLTIEHWSASIGKTFARGWDDPLLWNAGEFTEAMLINFRSLGATVLETDLGDDHAEATVTGFPDPDLCALFGVEIEQVARFNDATVEIARERGLTWNWTFDGVRTRYTADRAGD